MSNKFNKNFRRVYVGTDSPGAYTHWGVLPGGGYRTGDLASSIVTLDAAHRANPRGAGPAALIGRSADL